MNEERLGDVLRQLTTRGFVATGTRAGRRSFEGHLQCSKGAVRIQLVISDWDFLEYPTITIVDPPSFLPKLMPHVYGNGGLCYFRRGAVVLDRYDPALAIAQCLDQAKEVLDQIATNPDYRSGDIQDEFLAHWVLGQATSPWLVLKGSIDQNSVSANYSLIETGVGRRAVIASDMAEVEVFAEALGNTAPLRTNCKCWLFQTAIRPTVPTLMPATIKELFIWLKEWDRKVYNGIQAILEKEPAYLGYSFVTFAIDTPIGWLGFGFDLDQVTRLSSKRSPKLYKQYLHGKGGSRSLLRLYITDLSPSFVHSRNLSFADLRDKHIKLVGCGAIGSYLAQSLVRLGAGLGRGSLIPTRQTLQNAGRGHRPSLCLRDVHINKQVRLQYQPRPAPHRPFRRRGQEGEADQDKREGSVGEHSGLLSSRHERRIPSRSRTRFRTRRGHDVAFPHLVSGGHGP